MTEQESAEVWVFVGMSAFGAVGFGFWMHNGGAGIWCFAVFLLITCYVNDVTKSLKK